jgi:hypothetical protein
VERIAGFRMPMTTRKKKTTSTTTRKGLEIYRTIPPASGTVKI